MVDVHVGFSNKHSQPFVSLGLCRRGGPTTRTVHTVSTWNSSIVDVGTHLLQTLRVNCKVFGAVKSYMQIFDYKEVALFKGQPTLKIPLLLPMSSVSARCPGGHCSASGAHVWEQRVPRHLGTNLGSG